MDMTEIMANSTDSAQTVYGVRFLEKGIPNQVIKDIVAMGYHIAAATGERAFQDPAFGDRIASDTLSAADLFRVRRESAMGMPTITVSEIEFFESNSQTWRVRRKMIYPFVHCCVAFCKEIEERDARKAKRLAKKTANQLTANQPQKRLGGKSVKPSKPSKARHSQQLTNHFTNNVL
jgi:hypothetical protein